MFMTEREQQILRLIKSDPLIPQQVLADQLGLSRSAVAGHIMNLTKKGYIQGKGYIIAPDRYAVVVGGANMDLCGRADNQLVDGDSNPGTLTSSPGGVGRNIAENLARLGSQVQFIGALGDDRWGDELKACCRKAGVAVDHCLTIPGATSSSYLSIHGPDGEMHMALNDMKLIERLDSQSLAEREGVLARASALILDANLSENALDYLFNVADEHCIMVDPVSSVKAGKLIPYLDKVHTLKPNRLEAELLSGVPIHSEADLMKAATTLHEKGVKRLLISLGSDGALSSDGDSFERLSAKATQVNNVTGAGDALMAGLAHSYLKGETWAHSVHFALSAARLAVMSEQTINAIMSEHAVNRLLEESSPC